MEHEYAHLTPTEQLEQIALALYGHAPIKDVEAILAVAKQLEGIDLEDHSDYSVTARQGLALARFLRRMKKTEIAHITLGGQGLNPEEYILVQMSDGYTGGIDRGGKIST